MLDDFKAEKKDFDNLRLQHKEELKETDFDLLSSLKEANFDSITKGIDPKSKVFTLLTKCKEKNSNFIDVETN